MARIKRISEQRPSDLVLTALLRPHRLAPILFWRLIGKKGRARGRLQATIDGLQCSVERWNSLKETEDLSTIYDVKRAVTPPVFCVHVHIRSDDKISDVNAALKSAQDQSFPPACIFLTREVGAQLRLGLDDNVIELEGGFETRLQGIESALERAEELGAQWLVPLESAARLTRFALAGYCAHLVRRSEDRSPAVLYGDEVELHRFGAKAQMWLKPEWDARMALSQNYISWACAIAVTPSLGTLRKDQPEKPQGFYELILRLSQDQPVEHVLRVTAKTPKQAWRQTGGETVATVMRVVGEHADSIKQGPFGTVDLRFPLPDDVPRVSIIVATRDKVELLRTCVDGLLHGTDYPNFDVVIADNDSVETETLQYMAAVSSDPRVKVVRWPHPFNYSAINNFAVSQSEGEYVCLFNNDIEVLDPDWLTEMMREALLPGVGAVGARLLYPDRSIQHAGVAIGMGNAAGHAHRALPEGEPGYFAQALIARGASAVTAACLVVSRRHFDAVGGLDEEGLAVAYNDVDLCLKLQEQGLKNVYTPAATLIHHESKSRGLDFAPEHRSRYMRELDVFQKRWDTNRVVDPWHHPRLDRASEVYSLP